MFLPSKCVKGLCCAAIAKETISSRIHSRSSLKTIELYLQHNGVLMVSEVSAHLVVQISSTVCLYKHKWTYAHIYTEYIKYYVKLDWTYTNGNEKRFQSRTRTYVFPAKK